MSARLDPVAGLRYEIDGGVAAVTLDRAEHRNTLTREVVVGLWDWLVRLDNEPDVRAIVIGATGPFFSAGVALERGSTFSGRPVAYRHRPFELRTPIVGALSGSAVGLGLTLPLLWDVRFVVEEAKYGFVFVQRGVLPELGSAWVLPRLVGAARATDLILSGRLFSGREAAEWGIATEALPGTEVHQRALDYAHDLAAKTSPLMVGASKRMLWKSFQENDFGRAFAVDEACYDWVRTSPDTSEGIESFLEKRAPVWPSPKHDELPPQLRIEDRDGGIR